jgi:hypothetical protein
MKAVQRYALRLERKKYLVRAWRKGLSLETVADRTDAIRPADVLCFSTLRNERSRLKYFLSYYRDHGVSHFLFVDNDSDDGSREFLAEQADCSVWTTPESYKRARFGIDWMNRLLRLYGTGHWCLTVDPDEFLVYPFSDTRPIPALCDWLESSSIKSFGAMVVDMYPKGPITAHACGDGQNPFEVACWFDSGNYMIERNWTYGNLWIQGGPRARMFFGENPERAPALNKIPLVRWQKNFAYASSTHMLLPRGLNLVFDEWGGEKTSGVLLHAKFIASFAEKAAEEMERRQHYAASAEYKAYYEGLNRNPDLWTRWSERYINWRQLEILGLMSKGNWA